MSPYRIATKPVPKRETCLLWHLCHGCTYAAVGGCLGHSCLKAAPAACSLCLNPATRIVVDEPGFRLCNACAPPEIKSEKSSSEVRRK